MHRIAFVICAAATMATSTAGPRAGLIDPTFGNIQGIATHGFDLVNKGSDIATAFAEDAQGRFYLAGTVEDGEDAPCLGIMRFSPNGQLDNTYASGGIACVDVPPLQHSNFLRVYDSMVQADGSVLVAGTTGNGNLATKPFVCSLTATGALDLSFNSSGTPGCHVASEAKPVLDTNDKFPPVKIVSLQGQTLVVATVFDIEGGGIFPQIYRLGQNGIPIPFGLLEIVTPIAPQPTEGIFIVDIAASTNMILLAGQSANNGALLIEFNPATGAINPQFGDGGYANTGLSQGSAATALDVAEDGKITVVTSFTTDSFKTPGLLRLTQEGEIDPQFNDGKAKTYNPCVFMSNGCIMYASLVSVLPNGAIVFGGTAHFNANPTSMWVMRILPSGEADSAFGSTVLGQTGLARVNISSQEDAAYGMALQGERVILGGFMEAGEGVDNYDFALVRLADGSIFSDGLEANQ